MRLEYISAKEAAAFTGLTQRRINQLVNDGKLPGIRIGNSNAVEKGAELKRLRAKKNGNKKVGK